MSHADPGTRPNPIEYMTAVAVSEQGSAVRARVLAAMDLRPGQVVLDVGCGPGVNLADLAAAVTATGTVIGVDRDPAMVQEARRRTADCREVIDIRLGDAHALPVENDSVDRARADRILQHVTDPAAAIREMRRVMRPGGLVSLSEPDWASLVIDASDLAASAAFASYTCAEVVRNASVARQLARLAGEAGFAVRSAEALTPPWRDFGQADRLLGLTRNSPRAVAHGYLEPDQAEKWLAELRRGPFLAAVMQFTVTAVAVPASALC
jgi:ubiquinone/menaquinone biosynthesis C-methylase UbiE